MGGTKEARDWRRIERWFKHNGAMANVSDEAFDLLGLRLRARNRALLRCAPLFLVAAAILFWPGGYHYDEAGSPAFNRTFATRSLIAYAVLACAALLINVLTTRANRRIAETLPRRTSRGTAVSLKLLLGTVRLTYLAVAVGIEGALAVVLLVEKIEWVAWIFLVAYVVACSLVALGVRQAATRPTVAVDPTSLAIDERMRSEEAFGALSPLFALIIAFPGGIAQSGPVWLSLLWFAACVPVLLLSTWAGLTRPWQSGRLTPWIPNVPVPSRSGR
jgi:hypothetical protein